MGDYVIVHVGFAISKVDESEARRTFEVLRELSLLEELDWIGEVWELSPVWQRSLWRSQRRRFYAGARLAGLERGIGVTSGAVSLAFGAYLCYKVGFVDGLFIAQR